MYIRSILLLGVTEFKYIAVCVVREFQCFTICVETLNWFMTTSCSLVIRYARLGEFVVEHRGTWLL